MEKFCIFFYKSLEKIIFMIDSDIKRYQKYEDLIDSADKKIIDSINSLYILKVNFEKDIHNVDFKKKLTNRIKKYASELDNGIQELIDICR